MAGDARVSFRDAAGRESEAGLALVSAEVLAAGRPWRVFRWRQGQAHYSGWYWSATTGGHVVYESRLELGCPIHTLNRFARDHGIPVRSRGASSCIPAGPAPGIHPRDLPEPLRSALVGRHARRHLDNLLIIAGHASIRQAAQALGRWPSALYDQLGRTERACGGPLVNRSPKAPGTGILTPLGEQLCQQARDYLQPPAADPDAPPPSSRQRVMASSP